MKKHTFKVWTLAALMLAFLSSCSDDDNIRDATFLTLDELVNTPGFEWFLPEYNNYQPKQDIIDSIKTRITINHDLFILYMNPSCACTGTQKQFPAAVKILNQAGIDEPRLKVYSMYRPIDRHPYQALYNVRELPAIFTVRDSLPMYSIIDTLALYEYIYPNIQWKIEDIIFRALQD